MTGKAQETYSALSVADSANHNTIKSAILKTYELIPEAYHQKFKNSRKIDKLTLSFLVKKKPISTDGASQKILKHTMMD